MQQWYGTGPSRRRLLLVRPRLVEDTFRFPGSRFGRELIGKEQPGASHVLENSQNNCKVRIATPPGQISQYPLKTAKGIRP
jgi:hypothetical protein